VEITCRVYRPRRPREWHAHLHLLTTDGGVRPDGSIRRVPQWDPTPLSFTVAPDARTLAAPSRERPSFRWRIAGLPG
jgi:hypothetical protein